jgi:hypothetical protein
MKLILKWMLLILLMLASLKSSSQTVTDSTTIRLKKPIAQLIIKDLINGDGNKQEIILLGDKINILNKKSILKDSIIFNLDLQINNFNSILFQKSNQLEISRELTEKLQLDLKKQKFKTKFVSGIGIIAIIGTVLLIN